MSTRLQASLVAALLLIVATTKAEAQDRTVDNDVACSTACDAVNGLDQANDRWSAVQSSTQGMIDQARDFVNDVCSNSCQKPEEPWRED